MRRLIKRIAVAIPALILLVSALALITGWRAFGQRASGERLARMQRSPNYKDGVFINPQPLHNDAWGMLTGLFEPTGPKSPLEPVPVVNPPAALFETPPPSGLRVTWLGHSAQLIEIDGHRVLIDPIWSDRASPLDWVGPKRWYPPVIAFEAMPQVDAVVISHDHYDHLDHRTIEAMRDWKTTFVVPLGIGAHLEYWGVPPARIVELDWWERTKVGSLQIVCTPARHASGRILWDKDATLWAGFALIGEQHRVYYSGDTGLFPAMKQIGERLGPFDLTLIETGQYNRAWPDWHIGPEQAVTAHGWVKGARMLPVHWGLFQLAYHAWTEPVERSLAAATVQLVPLLTPKPGEPIEPAEATPATRWWPDVPWQTGAQAPIVSSQIN